MEDKLIIEKWPGVVSPVVIGATPQDGGSRGGTLTIGGEDTLPFLFKEGGVPNPPAVALEIWDTAPQDWPAQLVEVYGSALKDPFAWAEKCVNEFGPGLLCVRMQGAHPDCGNKDAKECADFISRLLKKIKLPLVITGCGDDEKDNIILPACSEAAAGEKCLLGCASQDNYKSLAAAAMADGHNIIAESPIDINIAKQLNILISDMGLPLERIVINPTVGALGYGLEYAYSIMERARLAALSGDKTLASPFVCFVGQEAWKAKESKAGYEQGVLWETISASSFLHSGADLLIMRHPHAALKVMKFIEGVFAGQGKS
jgi:acetyl-CoA decarbonylase/synthase complex subunit delta